MIFRLNRLAFETRFDMSHTVHYACNVMKYLELIVTFRIARANCYCSKYWYTEFPVITD